VHPAPYRYRYRYRDRYRFPRIQGLRRRLLPPIPSFTQSVEHRGLNFAFLAGDIAD
jgi:hypothetical protein